MRSLMRHSISIESLQARKKDMMCFEQIWMVHYSCFTVPSEIRVSSNVEHKSNMVKGPSKKSAHIPGNPCICLDRSALQSFASLPEAWHMAQ